MRRLAVCARRSRARVCTEEAARATLHERRASGATPRHRAGRTEPHTSTVQYAARREGPDGGQGGNAEGTLSRGFKSSNSTSCMPHRIHSRANYVQTSLSALGISREKVKFYFQKVKMKVKI